MEKETWALLVTSGCQTMPWEPGDSKVIAIFQGNKEDAKAFFFARFKPEFLDTVEIVYIPPQYVHTEKQ